MYIESSYSFYHEKSTKLSKGLLVFYYSEIAKFYGNMYSVCVSYPSYYRLLIRTINRSFHICWKPDAWNTFCGIGLSQRVFVRQKLDNMIHGKHRLLDLWTCELYMIFHTVSYILEVLDIVLVPILSLCIDFEKLLKSNPF